MNYVARVVVAGLLTVPATARAQIEEPVQGKRFGAVPVELADSANIVGTWIYTRDILPPDPAKGYPAIQVVKDLLTLKTDGTWTSQTLSNGKEDNAWPAETYGTGKPSGRWYFVDDSLWLSDPAKLSSDDRTRQGYKLRIDGGLLVTSGMASRTCTYRIFKRASAVASPSLPVLPPATVQLKDVAGTWVVDNDTLTLRADSTWSHWSAEDKKLTQGFWAILGGDLLWRYKKGEPGFYVKMILEDRLFLDEIGDSCTVFAIEEATHVYSRARP